MKVLITGGLGNVGSWITSHLLHHGFEVTTFSAKDRNVLHEYKFERIFGRIEKQEDVQKLFLNRMWDVIIHLASINEGSLPDYFQKALAINTLGTRNVLQSLAEKGHNSTHIIYFSTFHIYGIGSGIVAEDTTLPMPKNDYASTHLFAEYLVKQYYYSHAIPFTIFRLTNSYGCPKDFDSSKWYLVLNDLARMAVTKQVIKLNSNGNPRRDFIWIGDVCEVVKRCIENGPSNDTFNLGSGTSISMFEVAQLVKKAYEEYFFKPIAIEKNDADTNEYNNVLCVPIAKLQKWLNFEPRNRIYEEAKAIFDLLVKNGVSQ